MRRKLRSLEIRIGLEIGVWSLFRSLPRYARRISEIETEVMMAMTVAVAVTMIMAVPMIVIVAVTMLMIMAVIVDVAVLLKMILVTVERILTAKMLSFGLLNARLFSHWLNI